MSDVAQAAAAAGLPASDDPALQAPPLAPDLPIAMVYAERQAYFSDKVRAEIQVDKSRLELKACHALLERQTLELETLRGRGTALRVANEMANSNALKPKSEGGGAWGVSDARRFHEVPRSVADAYSATSDDLRDLLDLACIATSRRVNEALTTASWARSESERAAEAGSANLETAFANNDPGRVAARALLVQSNRSAAKLRAATLKLEEEAAAAQVRTRRTCALSTRG